MLDVKQIERVFREDCGWKCLPGGDRVGAMFSSSNPSRLKLLNARVLKGKFLLNTYRYDPENVSEILSVPKNRRHPVAEGIVRVNYGLLLGGFFMDYSDGEFGYRAAIPLGEDTLSDAVIAQTAKTCLRTYDRHISVFDAVIDGAAAPQAIGSATQDSRASASKLLKLVLDAASRQKGTS